MVKLTSSNRRKKNRKKNPAKRLEVTIEAIGPKGDGIARTDMGPAYIARAAAGDCARVEISKNHNDIWRGHITGLIEAGPARRDAPCPHYDECGGCALQHVTDQAYKSWKEETVRTVLARRDITPHHWQKTLFIPEQTRRRASFAVFKQHDKIIIGYHKQRSHLITDIKQCRVLDPDLMALRDKLKTCLAPVLKDSRPADLFIQKAGREFDVVLTGPVGRQKSGEPDMAVREAITAMAEQCDLARVGWRMRARDMIEPILQRRAVTIQMGALAVELPPGAFLQPSSQGEKALIETVLATLPEKGRFADLFSGCGTFSGPMLACGPVDAYESDEAAVEALHKAGGGMGLKAVERNLFSDPLTAKELSSYDAIVLDPPRAGARDQVEELAGSDVNTIIYVSCNPASFARDAEKLVHSGYIFEKLQLIDQFVWAAHCEMIGVFKRA